MLLQWKADDDDDADFSFEPSGNSFSQVMDYKPVVVPEWKERNIEFWDKNIALSETDGAASMQVWLRVDGRGQVEPSKGGCDEFTSDHSSVRGAHLLLFC